MALKRIYDQTLGQLAGVLVTTTGLGNITRDGTEAYAQAVTNVDSSGTSVDLATEETLVLVEADTAATAAALGTTGDSAWTGTGAASTIALLKPIATAALSTTPAEVVGGAYEYETVAASQTDQMLGPTGAAGDYLDGLLVIPATTSPGAVSIEDGSTNTTVFTGGASSVPSLIPFYIPLGINSVSGGWEITTGANVSLIAFGRFT